MSGRPLWNIRKRHEWLRQPNKRVHLKRRKRIRVGLEAALLRKRGPAEAASGDDKS